MSYPEPRYFGDQGYIGAKYRSVGEEPDLTIGGRVAVRYLATGKSTSGQFGLYQWDIIGPGPGAKPHFHRTMSESFYVLSGAIRFFNGEKWIDGTAGDFLYVPEGGVHGFQNDSSEPASMLILFSPGAPREAYFEAIAEMAAGRKFTDEEWANICIEHDNLFIDAKSRALYQKLLLGF
jgi:quercetin dioxygenase-like cupin family protein